jgi:catechol 2,3-dioxygenase-like lactoylglutathione lyase family enzyme
MIRSELSPLSLRSITNMLDDAGGSKYDPRLMPAKAGYSTPMLHVADVRRSIRFYELLGFELIDVEGDPQCPGWARIHCEGGALMFLLAEEHLNPSAQSILLAMYTPDLPALREHLLANGVEAPPITYPGYMPSGQITLKDPDGYIVGINHWSDKEHDAWLKNLEQKKKSGALQR